MVVIVGNVCTWPTAEGLATILSVTGSVLLDDVAVAVAATGGNEDRRHALDVAGMGDGEAAVDGLGDGQDFQKVGCYGLGDAFRVACVPFFWGGSLSRRYGYFSVHATGAVK